MQRIAMQKFRNPCAKSQSLSPLLTIAIVEICGNSNLFKRHGRFDIGFYPKHSLNVTSGGPCLRCPTTVPLYPPKVLLLIVQFADICQFYCETYSRYPLLATTQFILVNSEIEYSSTLLFLPPISKRHLDGGMKAHHGSHAQPCGMPRESFQLGKLDRANLNHHYCSAVKNVPSDLKRLQGGIR